MDYRVAAFVHYYVREGLVHHVQTVCNEVIKQAPSSVLQFWRAYGLLASGATSGAMRELYAVQSHPDVELVATAALLTAHQAAKVVDHDAVARLSMNLEAAEGSVTGQAGLQLAAYLFYTHSFERARSILERCLQPGQRNDGSTTARLQTLLGFVLLEQHAHEVAELQDERELQTALQLFDGVLQQEHSDLEALLGKARALEATGAAQNAWELLSTASLQLPWAVPLLVELARLTLARQDWEGLADVVGRLQQAATQQLADLASEVQQQEPQNAGLMLQLIVEVAMQQLMLDQPTAAAEGFEAALKLDELHMPAALGLAEAQLAAGQLAEAEQQLQFLPELLAASKAAGGLDAGATAATGSGRHDGRASGVSTKSAAGTQLVAGGRSEAVSEPLLLYLRGMLAWKQGRQQEGLQQLQQYLDLQLAVVGELPYGLAMFEVLHAGRVLGLLRMLLGSVGGDPRQPSGPPSPLLANCIRVLEMLARFTHAHPEAQLLATRAQFLNGALDAASRKAADILRFNGDNIQAVLLVVGVHVRQGRPAEAMAALEAAVSANFGIRDAPLYHVTHAQVLVANGRLEEAKQVLEAAMALPGVRTAATSEQAARLAKRGCLPSVHERCSIYLLLVDTIGKLNKGQQETPEAKNYLADAVREFKGTCEEVRVMVADCEAAIACGDVAGALQRLLRVPESSPHYTRARVSLAEIHLKHRQDRAAYIQCYLDLVETTPDCDSFCLLAEAFSAIQEPEKAANAYGSALALRPKDADLALAAAQALIAAHNYNRAIDYYNRAIRNDPSKLVLQHGLARLLLQLGQTRQATALLDKCLEEHQARGKAGAGGSLETLALDVDTWLLLAKLQQQSGNAEGFTSAQNQALELQRTLLEQLRQSGSAAVGNLSSAKAKAASICFDLAEYYRKHRQFDKVNNLVMHTHARYGKPVGRLACRLWHGAAHLALARLALADGQIEACQTHATALLEDQPDHEDAAIMLAELMAHQDNHESAVFYFQQLLDRKPCHYTALVQLLGLLRRAGKLEDAAKFITAAEAAAGGQPLAVGGAPRSSIVAAPANPSAAPTASAASAGNSKANADAGLHYCKGLLQWYMSNPRDALKHFNAARRDVKWSSQALLGMAEIYLHPENNISWASAGGEADGSQPGAAGAVDAETQEAVKAASTLLQQLRPADMESNKYKVLSAYTLMASKSRPDVEAAVGQLLDMANADPSNVPVLLGLAHGFLLLKQTAKARNQLKRVSKLPYKPDEADEFERAWLALADIHIAGGKFDLAQELCSRCLKYNQSCSRAWELLGSIAEREQAYKDAANHYEHAWKLATQADQAVGYKLAFNYMKAGRLVDAITVSQAVLNADPQYPKIRHDVLDKARMGLKP
ncbi:intraflagellar transport protein [Scenedesmus sp. NREL 46B-D3]|nr:intraflagellar transport protein [Scenedesmus sp. NREL 46B-D3]